MGAGRAFGGGAVAPVAALLCTVIVVWPRNIARACLFMELTTTTSYLLLLQPET